MTGFATPPSTIRTISLIRIVTTHFYPELLNEHQCIKYAAAVANDKDGYTGIQFCRWVADVIGKKENIDWDKFK